MDGAGVNWPTVDEHGRVAMMVMFDEAHASAFMDPQQKRSHLLPAPYCAPYISSSKSAALSCLLGARVLGLRSACSSRQILETRTTMPSRAKRLFR